MITPIEMYTMVPKSQEVSTQHSQANAKNVAMQQNGMRELSNEARHHEQQVVQTTSSQNPEYRYDAKEQGNGSYSGNQKKKKKKEDGSEPDSNGNGNSNEVHGFDIRI